MNKAKAVEVDARSLKLAQIADDLRKRLQNGDSCDLASYKKEHPELASENSELAAVVQIVAACGAGEQAAPSTLDHPHIVPVYGVGKERGVPYYAMKLIDGRSLAEIISEAEPLLARARQVAKLLATADPENAEYRHYAALSLYHYGMLLAWYRRDVEAANLFQQAARIQRGLIQESSGEYRWRSHGPLNRLRAHEIDAIRAEAKQLLAVPPSTRLKSQNADS